MRLPWYIDKKRNHQSFVLLKSMTKEVAVRAMYFPDEHLKEFCKIYNLKEGPNSYTKNIKDVVIFEKFDRVLSWCLDKDLYK